MAHFCTLAIIKWSQFKDIVKFSFNHNFSKSTLKV